MTIKQIPTQTIETISENRNTIICNAEGKNKYSEKQHNEDKELLDFGSLLYWVNKIA